MRDFTLVSYELIRVDCNQFDKHFCFFATCLCLETNHSHKKRKDSLETRAEPAVFSL